MVIWIIGMSGSGKSTLGRSIHKLMKPRYPGTVLIDGDGVREMMGNDLGHSIEDRWTNAQRISKMCLHLDQQGIYVVCAILSIFHESQKWNREHFSNYKEIYLEVSMDTLRRRDPRGLYARASQEGEQNVVGVDIEFKPPYAPDLVLNNDTDSPGMEPLARQALADLDMDLGAGYRYSQENRLIYPEKYEYTEYQGRYFLESYVSARNNTIEELADKVSRMEDLYGSDNGLHPWTAPLGLAKKASIFLNRELPELSECFVENGRLSTRRYLARMTSVALAEGTVPDFDLLLKLLQRFEVSKRLFEAYQLPDLRRSGIKAAELLDYGLFATLLSILCDEASPERRLILFNTILKLNDTLESVAGAICTPVEHYLALTALRKEKEIYGSLRGELLA